MKVCFENVFLSLQNMHCDFIKVLKNPVRLLRSFSGHISPKQNHLLLFKVQAIRKVTDDNSRITNSHQKKQNKENIEIPLAIQK